MPRKMTKPRKTGDVDVERFAEQLAIPSEAIGLIIVDHGSRREESNQMLLRLVDEFRKRASLSIIEPAHMELAAPSIDDAFAACAAQGAKFIVVHPYFLLPGRHWNEDIPTLSAAAAQKHGNIPHLVTAPLGLHPMMIDVIQSRVQSCLEHALGQGESCELCENDPLKCQLQGESRPRE